MTPQQPLPYVLLATSLFGVAGCQGRDALPSAADASSPPLQVSGPIDLGVLACGGSHSLIVQYVNRSEATHRLSSFSTSCSCIAVTFVPVEVDPLGQGYIQVMLDLGPYTCGSGLLNFDIKGYDESGKLLLTAEVHAQMVSTDALRAALPSPGPSSGKSGSPKGK